MVSIIIPSYNQEKYLADAVESALDQDVQGEIIIVDDGSIDHSLEIAKKFETDRPDIIRVISQTNRGLAAARNTGIMNAKYPWILPLDADDILLENATTKILEYMAPDVDVIGLSLKEFGVSNTPIILKKNPILADFKKGNHLGYCCAIRKEVLLECGGYNPKMTWGYEDLYLWIDLLSRGKKVVTIPEVLWLYRTKPESMYTEAKKHHQELLGIINKDFPEAELDF